jgi:hypothetical protein
MKICSIMNQVIAGGDSARSLENSGEEPVTGQSHATKTISSD